MGWYGLVWAGMGHAWLVQSQLLTCIDQIEFPGALAITVAKLLASCSTGNNVWEQCWRGTPGAGFSLLGLFFGLFEARRGR
jgi:hypothetical protein